MRVLRIAAALVLALGIGSIARAQDATPLGDVVKQKPAKKASRIVTDDDMPQRAPSAAAKTAAGSESTPSVEKEAKDAAPSNVIIQQQIRMMEEYEAARKRVIEKFQAELDDPETNSLRKEIYTESIRRAKEQLSAYETERHMLEQMLADQQKSQKTQPAPDQSEDKPAEQKFEDKPAEQKAPANPAGQQ